MKELVVRSQVVIAAVVVVAVIPLLVCAAWGSPYSSGGAFSLLHAPAGSIAGGGPVDDGMGTPVVRVDVSVGEGEDGAVSELSGGAQLTGNLIGQYYDVTGFALAAYPMAVIEGMTRQVSGRAVMDDASQLVLPALDVGWSAVSGPVTIDLNGLMSAGMVGANGPGTVQGDWMGFSDQLSLTVFDSLPVLPGPEEDWENLLGTGSYTTNEMGGAMVSDTVIALSDPLLGATATGDTLAMDLTFDGASLTGGGSAVFGFHTLGSNFGEGIVVRFVDSATPGEDVVRIESLLTGDRVDYAVGDFNGAGSSELAFHLFLVAGGGWDYHIGFSEGGVSLLDASAMLSMDDLTGDTTIQMVAGAFGGSVTGLTGTFAATLPPATGLLDVYLLAAAPGGGGGPVDDGGGGIYFVDSSVADEMDGAVSDVVGTDLQWQAKGNLVGQFYDVAGLYLASYPETVLQGRTLPVDSFMRMDDWTFAPLAVGEVGWSVADGPIAVDGNGVVTGGLVTQNSAAMVRGDWLSFVPATLDLTVLFAIPTLPGVEEDWEKLLNGGGFEAEYPGGASVDRTVIGFHAPLLGAGAAGEQVSLDLSFDGLSVVGGSAVFGFHTLGSNLGEGIVVVFNDQAVPGADTVRLESLLTGAGVDFVVGDFSGSGKLDLLWSLVLRSDGQWDFFLRVRDDGIVILDEAGQLNFADLVGDLTIQALVGSPTGTVTGIEGTFSGTNSDAGTGQRFYTLAATPGGGGGPISGMLGGDEVFVDSSVSDEAAGRTSDEVAGMGGALYFERGNLIGQFYDSEGLLVSSNPATVEEGATRQLEAVIAMDDATVVDVEEREVSWSVQAGPVVGIDEGGLATADFVFEDSFSTLRGVYGGGSDDYDLSVLNVGVDDLLGYAGDGIDDDWQVGFFGLPPNADAGPGANQDGDPDSNLREFLGGFDPTDATSFLQFTVTGKTGSTVDFLLNKAIAGRIYRLMESGDLATEFTEAGVFSVLSEEVDTVIQDADAPPGRNFYRLRIENDD